MTNGNQLYKRIKEIARDALSPHPDLGKPYIYSWIENEERNARDTFFSRYFSEFESEYKRCRREMSKRELPFHRMARRLLDDVHDMPEEYFSIDEFRTRLEALTFAFRSEDERHKSPGFHGIATPPFLKEWWELLNGRRS